MSGIQNSTGISPLYVPMPAPPALPNPAGLVPASMPGDQLSLQQPTGSGGPAPAADPSGVLQQVRSGNAVQATMAIYQLEAFGASHRNEVVAALLEQLAPGSPDTNVLASIEVLRRLRAPEAASALQSLALNSSSSAIRQAASEASGGPAKTAVRSNQPLVAPGGVAGVASVPTAAAPAPEVNADFAGLTARLLDRTRAPGAVVQLAQLPPAQMLSVVQGVLSSGYSLDPDVADLIVSMLIKRRQEPGVTDCLRQFCSLYPSRYPNAVGKAVLALYSTHDPQFLPDVMRFLVHKDFNLASMKRALIDEIAKRPQELQHPAMAPTLAAILHEREDPDLAAAASHALGKTRSKIARDALVASPLLAIPDPPMNMRAMWDLASQPAPYPPEAIARLKELAESHDAQVQKLAKQLLAKKKS